MKIHVTPDQYDAIRKLGDRCAIGVLPQAFDESRWVYGLRDILGWTDAEMWEAVRFQEPIEVIVDWAAHLTPRVEYP